MRAFRGPCTACDRGRVHESFDGDIICTTCSYRERASGAHQGPPGA